MSFSSINPDTLRETVDNMAQGANGLIQVIEYKGYMYILEGNYEMLAANILGKEKVEIEIVESKELPFWGKEENILSNIEAINISTLYDFEAVGEFSYDDYPPYYGRG